MKHRIEIDDRSKAGKSLLALAKLLAENKAGIRIIDEAAEDALLLKKMATGRKSGILNPGEKEAFLQSLKETACQ